MKGFKAIPVLLLTMATVPAQASNLVDLYQETMASDPRLLRAESEEALYQARERYQFGGLLPKASVGAQGTRTRRDAATNQGLDARDYYNGEKYYASVSQPLYDKPKWEAYRAASKEAGRYSSRYDETRSLIAVDLVDRYTKVLAAEDNYAFVKAERESAEEQLDQVRARHERKLAKVTDLLAVEARANMLFANEIEALNAVAIAREGLSEVLGREVTESLDPLNEAVAVAWELGSLEEWVQKSLQDNSSLKASRLALEAAAAGVKQAAGQRHPSLSMSLTAQKSDIGFENAQVPTTEVYVAALNLTIPIYSGGQVSAQVSEARSKLRMAEQDYEQIERELRKKAREAFLNVKSARERANAARKAVSSAKKSVEAQEKGFSYGTVTAVDVLAASQTLYEAKRDFRQAYYDLMLHWVSLQQVAGQFSPANIAEINGWLEVAQSAAQE
jgi:outer membrane protein